MHRTEAVNLAAKLALFPLQSGATSASSSDHFLRDDLLLRLNNGALSFGVSGDYDTTADLQMLCDGIERGLAELADAAAVAPAAPGS